MNRRYPAEKKRKNEEREKTKKDKSDQ